MADTVI